MKAALPPLRLTPFIDGAFESSGVGGDPLLDPSTGEVVASVQSTSGEQALKAIAAARRAFDDGDSELTYVIRNPALDSLRSDPRYKDLMHRLNLPE